MQHPVGERLLAAIGDISVSFALLESQLQTLCGSLFLEHQRIGQIVTAELSFRNLRALTMSLFLERHGVDDDDTVRLRGFMRRAAILEEQRNQITHSVWAAGDGPDTVTRIKMTAKERHGARFDFSSVSADDLARIADQIKQLAADIQYFHVDLLQQGKAINSPFQPLWGPEAIDPAQPRK